MVVGNPDEELELKEAKDQYSLELDRKKTLEGKANNITTISGTVAVLLFGLGQFLIDKLANLHYAFLPGIIFFLLLGSSLSVVAILLSLYGFRVSDYYYVIAGESVQEPSIVAKNFASFKGKKNDWTKQYVENTRKNAEINNKKAAIIKGSELCFSSSVITIPIVLLILLVSYPSGGPKFTWQVVDIINQGNLASYGQTTGLDNIATQVFLTADNASAAYGCFNSSTNQLHDKTIPVYEKNLRGHEQDLSTINGQISFAVYMQAPLLHSSVAASCTSSSGTIKLMSIMYHNVILHIQQNGTNVLTNRLISISQ